MPTKVNPSEKKLATWLQESLGQLPKGMNVAAVEWNTGWPSVEDHRAGKPRSMLFTMSALARDGDEPFDPEDPDHLDELSEPAWECEECCALPTVVFDNVDPYDFFQGVLKNSKSLQPLLEKIQLAYGEHESDLKLHRTKRTKAEGKSGGPNFYELNVSGGANSIDKYELGGFKEKPLLDHDRVTVKPGKGMKLFLQKRPRLKDFLHFYRGWIVCSERAMKLFREATDKIQVFPAPLYDQNRKVEGYYVVNLYEKLDCLRDEDVRPPDYKGGPKSFDPGEGYRLKLSVVKDRQVFRINYEHFRLLVSQEFRDKLEKAKITGLEWLRRLSVP